MSCQRLAWREPGGVGVGELVHQQQGGTPGQRGVEVELLQVGAAVLDDPAGKRLEAVEQAASLLPAVGFQDAHDHVEALSALGASRLEHGVGLPDARRGAEEELETAAAGLLLRGLDLAEERVWVGAAGHGRKVWGARPVCSSGALVRCARPGGEAPPGALPTALVGARQRYCRCRSPPRVLTRPSGALASRLARWSCLVQREVQEQHVDPPLSEHAKLALLQVPFNERADRLFAHSPRRATRRTCAAALAGEMCGSSPEPEVVAMSLGTCPRSTPSSSTARCTAPAIERVGEFRVRRALVGAGRRGGVVALAGGRRAGMEVARPGEPLADERAADPRPSRVTSEPFAWRGRAAWRARSRRRGRARR